MVNQAPPGWRDALDNGKALIGRDPAMAAEQARALLRAAPHDREAHALFVAALQASTETPLIRQVRDAIDDDRLNDAVSLLMPHLRERPHDAAALTLLAETAERRGQYPQADRFLREALALAPDFRPARHAMARLYLAQDLYPEAIESADRILAANPGDRQASKIKAAALQASGARDEAATLYAALARDDGDADDWVAYARHLRRQDDDALAIDAYRQAIALAPRKGAAWWGLAELSALDEADGARIDELLTIGVETVADAVAMRFALARLRERQDPAAAFREYDEANYLRRRMLGDEITPLLAEVERSVELFTPAFIERHRDNATPADPCPIFVVGMPLAGCDEVARILGEHRDVELLGQTNHLPALIGEIIGSRWRDGQTSWPALLADLPPGSIAQAGRAYLDRIGLNRRSTRPFFVDSLPNNWAHVGLISLILPGAKIIDVRRDPMALGWANYRHHFAGGHATSYSLAEFGRAYCAYDRLMRHWDAVLPGNVRRVDADALAGDRAAIVHLGEFVGLDTAGWNPAGGQQLATDDGWRMFIPWLEPLRQALGVSPVEPANAD
jgi:tetratricopeptide (TPR) repeat protein